MNTIIFVREALDAGDLAKVGRETVILQQLKSANYVNRKGYALLEGVAARLLDELNLTLKVSLTTAKNILLDCFSDDLEKRQRKGVSEEVIIQNARKALKSIDLPSGSYVFSTQFSYSAKNLRFHFGPVTIVSKARFFRENATKLRASWPGSEDTHEYLLKKWVQHMKEFDHLVLVDLNSYERELGWKITRECAEFALNIVRMFFGYYHTKRIRLTGDFVLEQNQSSLVIEGDNTWLSHGTGGVSSFLDNDAIESFGQELETMSGLLASFAGWLASGQHHGTPTAERLRYASMLIAEAYCEPSDYIRLVRLISALEAIAVIRSSEKAHELAVRCANVGSWGKASDANKIYDAVREAYRFRNMVVHGDAPSEAAVRNTFFRLERYLFAIFVGYLGFYAGIERTVAPRSIRTLAREIRERIDFYFYSPDFGFD